MPLPLSWPLSTSCLLAAAYSQQQCFLSSMLRAFTRQSHGLWSSSACVVFTHRAMPIHSQIIWKQIAGLLVCHCKCDQYIPALASTLQVLKFSKEHEGHSNLSGDNWRWRDQQGYTACAHSAGSKHVPAFSCWPAAGSLQNERFNT